MKTLEIDVLNWTLSAITAAFLLGALTHFASQLRYVNNSAIVAARTLAPNNAVRNLRRSLLFPQ